jgi:adenine-specific DNA-methyltransferase
MEKMRMESVDMTAQNIDKIAALFPNCITEANGEDGKLKKVVNFELLRQMLSGEIQEGDESYEFTWVGKKAAIAEAYKPIRKTLRPCIQESVDWETTENLYIEGDNLEVLKLLQESYLGGIKMIYIDPPYNTGNDFIYRDNFGIKLEEYEEQIGIYDEDGDRLFKNTDSNGRFHSDWCSMIYSRLLLARNLLADDGVIFISMDNPELDNLLKICDEVFGRENFVETLVWKKIYGGKNDSKWFAHYHDFIVVYTKNKELWRPNLLPRSDDANARYKNPDNDPRGPWKAGDFTGAGATTQSYPIITPTGRTLYPPEGKHWIASKDNYEKLRADNRIWFGSTGDNVPSIKRFLSEVKSGMAQISILDYSEVGHSDEANRELKRLMGGAVFDYPKPTRLLQRLVHLGMGKNDVVLDFFSGSATTAHATMKLNAEDGGRRKYIMVQLPEEVGEKTDAKKAGYNTICDIAKERIKRAAKQIKDESPLTTDSLDMGFRVLKVADSNMNDVYYSAGEYTQNMLSLLESNVKSDRTDLDLLFGCLLEWGLPLSMPYTSEQIDGCTVHTYNEGDLVACFDENIPDSVIKVIAKRQPLRAVFRDSSFEGSPAKINVGEIFKMLAPDTRVKVI